MSVFKENNQKVDFISRHADYKRITTAKIQNTEVKKELKQAAANKKTTNEHNNCVIGSLAVSEKKCKVSPSNVESQFNKECGDISNIKSELFNLSRRACKTYGY